MTDIEMESVELNQENGEAAETVPVKTENENNSSQPTGNDDNNVPISNGDLSMEQQQLQIQEESVKEEAVKQEAVKQEAMTDASGPVQKKSDYESTETYKMFMNKNLSKPVADNLIRMFEALSLNTDEFDDRAVEMLATFPVEQANYIVKELRDSQLYGVQNKPQYLMSVMRNFRDRLRSMGAQQAMELPLIPGPDPLKIKKLIDESGYQLEVTVGQRKYHSPPGYDGPDPNQTDGGCIYIGQIPKDIYEDALVPLFAPIGQIFDLRIMMDPVNGKSRGYGFLIYCDKSRAQEAAKKYDGHEILPGKPLKVNVSVANTRLFLGNIPKSKSKDEILEELRKHTENVTDVIIYTNPDAHDGRKNRGFCFVDFTDHKAASDVKRRISMGKIRPWNTDLVVDWAEQQDEPDEEVMSQVKVLYVRNLKESVTEERLKEMFGAHGAVEKVKRIKDYAFIHFEERGPAVAAMKALNGNVIDGVEVEISLAKPQGDNNQKKRLTFKSRFGQQQTYAAATPGLGARGRGNKGYDYMAPPRGRGAGPSQRGSAMGGFQAYPGYPPAGYGPPPYDPYYAGYGGYAPGYDMYGGGYPQVDPYYAPQPSYGAPPMRGAAVPYGGGYGTIQRGRGGKSASGGQGRGIGPKRGMAGGRGGSKRAGGDFGGPASKRGGRGEDFSSDISMNMF